MILELKREYRDNYTKGVLSTPFGDIHTLELKWDDNKRSKSCIPEGTYAVIKSQFWGGRNKGKPAFRFKNVPNRSGILFHIGNFLPEIQGCILVGMKFNNNAPSVLQSTIAFEMMWEYLPDEFQVRISKQDEYEDFTVRDDFGFFNDYQGLENEVNSISQIEKQNPKKRTWLYVLFGLFLLKLLRK